MFFPESMQSEIVVTEPVDGLADGVPVKIKES